MDESANHRIITLVIGILVAVLIALTLWVAPAASVVLPRHGEGRATSPSANAVFRHPRTGLNPLPF